MSQSAEFLKGEEGGVALDGVKCAKNTVQPLGVLGIVFQCKEIVIEAVQSFTRLREEFPEQLVDFAHGVSRNW